MDFQRHAGVGTVANKFEHLLPDTFLCYHHILPNRYFLIFRYARRRCRSTRLYGQIVGHVLGFNLTVKGIDQVRRIHRNVYE